MKRRIADALIRLARRLDPNSCLDWKAVGHAPLGTVFVNVEPRIDTAALQRQVDQLHRSAAAFGKTAGHQG